jgi:hypothetical protein
VTRKGADRVLRALVYSTAIGVAIVVVAAIVVSEHRGLLLAIGAVYLLTSIGAYIGLSRSLDRAFDQARHDREASGGPN